MGTRRAFGRQRRKEGLERRFTRQSGSDEGDFALEDGFGGGGAFGRAGACAWAGCAGCNAAGDKQRSGTGRGRPARAAEFQLAGHCHEACGSAGGLAAACNCGRSTQCCGDGKGSRARSQADRDAPRRDRSPRAAASYKTALCLCCCRRRASAVGQQPGRCGAAAVARTSSIGLAGDGASRIARTRAQAVDPALAAGRRCARSGYLVPPLASAAPGGAGGGTGTGRICRARAGAGFAARTASIGSSAASSAATANAAATPTQTGTARDEWYRRLAVTAFARDRNAAPPLPGRRQPGHDRVRG